jgi:CheY-like chemotaxis protein
MCKQNEYDIIFMDHMMPVMDGIETTALIRQLDGWARTVPIVALTANVAQGAREMFIANGLDDFLPKPIDNNEIAACLLKWLPSEMVVYED